MWNKILHRNLLVTLYPDKNQEQDSNELTQVSIPCLYRNMSFHIDPDKELQRPGPAILSGYKPQVSFIIIIIILKRRILIN